MDEALKLVRGSDEEHKRFRDWQEAFVNENGHPPEVVDAWQARAALASAPAQQWISVRDRLPAEGQPVMFVVASKYPDYNGRVFGGSFCMLADVPSFNTPGVGYRASHWMPLPEAPSSSVASKEEPTS